MNHRPLALILRPKKGIPHLAAAHLQRWSPVLLAYQYTIRFHRTQDHASADSLSRLPVKGKQPRGNSPQAEVFNLAQMQVLPVTADKLPTATTKDPVLGHLLRLNRYGWPDSVPEVLKFYCHQRWELSVEDECVMWGLQVVVSKQLQSAVQKEL